VKALTSSPSTINTHKKGILCTGKRKKKCTSMRNSLAEDITNEINEI
jgi:hypothetical protein